MKFPLFDHSFLLFLQRILFLALKTLTGLTEKHSGSFLPSMQRKLDSSDNDFSLADFSTTVSSLGKNNQSHLILKYF